MNSGFTRTKTGSCFKEDSGKLYRFAAKSIEVMVAWPNPKAWRKTKEQPFWIRFRPEIKIPSYNVEDAIQRHASPLEENGQLLLSFLRVQYYPQKMQLRWYSTIPPDIRQLLAPYQSRQWHLLSFLARGGTGAAELVAMNPALAFALASNWVFHKPDVQQPLRAARALVKKRQRDALAWLGFPGTEAARKVLAKIIPESVSISCLLYLRDAMADNTMFKAMSHLPRLNTGVLRMVTDPQLFPFTTPALLEEIALYRKENLRSESAYLLSDSKRMYEQLYPNATCFPVIRRRKALQGFHDMLVDEMAHADIDTRVVFPPPPIEGTDTIIPITNAEDLVTEGRMQHHCIASYINQVAWHKKLYVYRVLKPERATLAVVRKHDAWHIHDLKLACNAKPSGETYHVVMRWLERQCRDLAI
jgi:hypothetical protein